MIFTKSVRTNIVGILLLTFLASCSQPLNKREKGALVGGGFGAATGAIIGAAVGNPGAGAAIGGAIGAAGGGIIGDQLQGIENRQNAQQAQINAQQRQINRQRRELNRLKKKTRAQQYQNE
ncbi:MAG: YMGG-like glycine zipper-containing protein [Candidatus Binatia bacterium]